MICEVSKKQLIGIKKYAYVTTKDYCMTGRANLIFCAVGLR